MKFGFSAEQDMLRDTARRFLDDKAPPSVVRAAMESDPGFDAGLWDAIAAQGWQSLAISEEFGGAGFGFMEQAILLEEMGRVLCPVPYLSSIVLGATVVGVLGTDRQCGEILPAVASGETRLALCHLEQSGRWGPDGIEMTAAEVSGGYALTGEKLFVLDGHTADTLLVVARLGERIRVFVVPGDDPGVTRTKQTTLDSTRPMAAVTFDDVAVPDAALLGDEDDGWRGIEIALRHGAVALACEQVGGAQRCLDMSVAYAKERIQFGRPIGSFQAVKHRCADMLVAVESARSAAYHAASALATGADDSGVAAAVAKSYCSGAYSQCAGDSIQIHGGVGFTWEHDAHLYFKRAKASELLFGAPGEHRRRLATALEL